MNHLRFSAGVFSFFIGGQILLFVIPLYVFLDTRDIGQLGLLLFIEWTPALIAFPLAGYWVDKISAIRTFQIANGMRALACLLAFAALQWYPAQGIYILTILAAIASFFLASARVSTETLVAENTEGDTLAKFQAVIQSAEISSMLFGPVLASLCVLFLEKETLVLLAALSFAFPLLCTKRIIAIKRNLKNIGPLQQTVRGFKLLLSNQVLMYLVLLNCTVNFLASVVMGLNAAVVTDIFAMPEQYYGYLNSAGGVVALLAMALVPAMLKKYQLIHFGVGGLAGCFIAAIALTFLSSFASYVAAYIAMLSAITVYNVYNRTLRAQIIPKADFGIVMGAFSLLNISSVPLSGLAIYLFGNSLGYQPMLLCTTVITAVSAAVLMLLLTLHNRKSLSPATSST